MQNSPLEKLINLKGTKYEGRTTFTSMEKIMLYGLLKSQNPDLFKKDKNGVYKHNPYGLASKSWSKMYKPVCPQIVLQYLILPIQCLRLDSDKLL